MDGMVPMCRVCASEDDLVMKITEPLEIANIPIMSVLMQCCYPVKISANDNLPKDICGSCLQDLKIAHTFRTRCLDSIKKIHIKMDKQTALKRKQVQELRTQQDIKKQKQISNTCLPEENTTPPVIALEKYCSPIGRFNCSAFYNILNFSFYQADNYIYSIGLRKNIIRTLHCIVPQCPSIANQKLFPNNEYEESIEVLKSHNHPSCNDTDRKKQIFYYAMLRRVQYDKSLNIKNLYEEFCKMEPTIVNLIPLRNVISDVCKNKLVVLKEEPTSFELFYNSIESLNFSKLHFTSSGQQFYQEKFACDESLAVVFSNQAFLEKLSDSELMYVDASFKIDTNEDFKYQLVTILLWFKDTYYPVLFAFINKKSQEIFKKIFQHLQQDLAPNLRPKEIVTDFEANLYYALAETYYDSNIGGSIFYYTQNLYKKVCTSNLSRDLETNAYFRSIYHMLLMLPLLPVNTILDGFNNVVVQAKQMGLIELSKPLFDHVKDQWINNVTADLFCVHRLENRINENVIAPLKKLRDFLLQSKGTPKKDNITITQVVEKLIDLEAFLNKLYEKKDKKSFGRDLSSSQKRNVLRAWNYIESNPKININSFFTKVLGYIKCMENQLWIWGFYRYIGDGDDELINASNFCIVGTENSNKLHESTILDKKDGAEECNYQDDAELLLNRFPNSYLNQNEEIFANSEQIISNQEVPTISYDHSNFSTNVLNDNNNPIRETETCDNEQFSNEAPLVILNNLLNHTGQVVVEMKSIDLINIGNI